MKLKLKNIFWVYAFLMIAAAYTAGLFIDLTGDAGLYAAISRQMVDSGDWFNLKINNEAYYEKPHLLFWLAGTGIKLFGNTNFGFKIFPVLYGWLGFYFTYRLGQTLYSKEVGKLAALFIATSQIFFLYSLDIHTDSVLQTGVVLALWQLAEYLKYNKLKNFIIGFAGIGLAMLAKGPVGAVLPFFSVLFYLLVQKKYRQIFHQKWLFGIVIVLIIISPALIHLFQNFGWLGIQFYFITNNFGRISGEYAGSSTDPFFYLYNMIWIFLPWTIFVFAAVYCEIKSWFSKKERNPWSIYLLGSVLVYFVIISVARGKAPNYAMIAVSPLIIVAANWMVLWKRGYTKIRKDLLRANHIFLSVFGLIFFAILFIYRGEKIVWYIPVLLFSSIAAVVAIIEYSDLLKRTIYLSVILIGTFNLLLNTRIIPELASYQGARQVLEIFEENRNSGDMLYNLHIEEYELFYYSDRTILQTSTGDEYKKMIADKNAWIYTTQGGYQGILDNIPKPDSVFKIKNRGLNDIRFQFLNPNSRHESLNTNYLIKLNMN